MNNIITVSDNAIRQIKKIISSASSKVDGVIVDVDKTGCSGYAYKLDYAKNTDSSKYEVIEKDGIKIFIEPILVGLTLTFFIINLDFFEIKVKTTKKAEELISPGIL